MQQHLPSNQPGAGVSPWRESGANWVSVLGILSPTEGGMVQTNQELGSWKTAWSRGIEVSWKAVKMPSLRSQEPEVLSVQAGGPPNAGCSIQSLKVDTNFRAQSFIQFFSWKTPNTIPAPLKAGMVRCSLNSFMISFILTTFCQTLPLIATCTQRQKRCFNQIIKWAQVPTTYALNGHSKNNVT